MQVSEELGDKIQILKIDTDENPDLSNSLRVIFSALLSGPNIVQMPEVWPQQILQLINPTYRSSSQLA